MHSDDFARGGADDYYDDDEHEPCSKKIMPALFAWFLLISMSASYFTLVLPEYINLVGLENLHFFIAVTVAHGVLFLFVLLNFSIATFMDPGRFPKVDIKDVIEDNGNHQTGSYKSALINDINVRMKWCTTCQFYRPPRSSHCGVCNACIDTMDHHCPWVCNCIGRRNYKYFFQFLITLTIHMLIILGLCITLVLLNKEQLTHIPIIIAMFLIVATGILIIPIGGLTVFHIVLVSRGRTTNEQVTGKFRTGVNPFDEGFCTNWRSVVCNSVVPSYLQFKRRRHQHQEYLEDKLIEQKVAQAKLVKQQHEKQKQIYRNTNQTNEAEMAPFVGKNSNQYNQSNQQQLEEVVVSSKEMKKSKRGGSSASGNDHQQRSSSKKGHQTSNGKLAKITKNNGYPNNGTGHNHRAITSPGRQKRSHHHQHQKQIVSDFQQDELEFQDALDEEQFYQQQQIMKQQQKLLRHQQKELRNQRQSQPTGSSNNVWVNRSQPNQFGYNNDDYDNTSNLIMAQQEQQLQPAFRSQKELKIAKSSNNYHVSTQPKHSSHGNKVSSHNTNNEKHINKLMMSAGDSNNHNHKLGSIPSSSTNESSSGSSNRCIRNNSYLNANPTVNGLLQQQQEAAQIQITMLNGNPPSDLRPSSSSSNSSGSSGMSKQHQRRSKSSHNQVQLEIINEKNQHHHMPNGEAMPDYASYEITV